MSAPVGPSQHGTNESKANTADSALKGLCKVGGVAALMVDGFDGKDTRLSSMIIVLGLKSPQRLPLAVWFD